MAYLLRNIICCVRNTSYHCYYHYYHNVNGHYSAESVLASPPLQFLFVHFSTKDWYYVAEISTD